MSEPIKINYVSHDGNHQVAIVLCPNICHRFLHLSKDVDKDDSWKLRDYIGSRQIDRRDHLGEEELSNIEDKVLQSLDVSCVLDENIETTEMWKSHLIKLSRDFIDSPDLTGTSEIFAKYGKTLNAST